MERDGPGLFALVVAKADREYPVMVDSLARPKALTNMMDCCGETTDDAT